MRNRIIVVAVVAMSSAAFAQAPAPSPVAPTPVPASPRKDPTVAVALSIAPTLAGTAVLFAGGDNDHAVVVGMLGMYFGPSIGQMYGNRFGAIGLATRALALVMIAKGSERDLSTGPDLVGDEDRRPWLWGGIGLWVGSTVFDFVMAHRAATAWNREHQLTLAPTVLSSAGDRTPAVALQLKF